MLVENVKFDVYVLDMLSRRDTFSGEVFHQMAICDHWPKSPYHMEWWEENGMFVRGDNDELEVFSEEFTIISRTKRDGYLCEGAARVELFLGKTYGDRLRVEGVRPLSLGRRWRVSIGVLSWPEPESRYEELMVKELQRQMDQRERVRVTTEELENNLRERGLYEELE